VPVTQGMLYVGSVSPLSDDEIDVTKKLADAFSVAYARYEDFQRLEAAKAEVEAALENLKKTQSQLVQAEKMASLGQLTAGIAHEIKNPLNFVNNFAELSGELLEELREEIEKGKAKIENREDIEDLLTDLQQNAQKINEHGKRADSIVKGMLQHSRGGKGERQPTDLNALLEEDLNLAYHGMRAQDSSFNVTMEKQFDTKLPKVDVVPQDISRVFLNIITNGFHAVHERRQNSGNDFSPKLLVQTQLDGDTVVIRIKDNGSGIPADIRENIFQPFFTTKPTGQGTGLGLSISYDIIVQEHHGEIQVDSKQGEFTEFIITLPVNADKP
jgi:signal transduction histidine kinase